MAVTSRCRYFVDSEYKPLKAVLLHKPTAGVEGFGSPQEVLYLKKIDYLAIKEEYKEIIRLYRKLKIKVYFIEPEKFKGTDNSYLFNMMYTRDLLFMTPYGAILAKMASRIRKDEVKYAQRTLKIRGIPIVKIIEGNAAFEGADALWVNGKLVMVGVGNRTNFEGFSQVKDVLEPRGIRCICVPAVDGALHLLGALQFIGRAAALVRVDLIGKEIMDFLRQHKINIIKVPENIDVREKQAMNIVTLSEGEIIMPAGCPEARKIYQRQGIKIAAEVKIGQLINGGGGLGCATAVIER